MVYRRYTNFAIEAIQQTFNGNPRFGNRVTCQISRNGDLIHHVYLVVDNFPTLPSDTYSEYVGLRLIKSVDVEIGGQRIDRHYAEWMYIWNELSLPYGKKAGYKAMVGQVDGGVSANSYMGGSTLYIPLEFWFCRNVGLSLPLIALQYHEVKINIDFEQATNLIASGVVPSTNYSMDLTASLWVDYVYLDTDERRRFAQLSHEYLIEQLQFTGTEVISAGKNQVRMNFNHPVKELIWTVQRSSVGSNMWTNYVAQDDVTLASASNNVSTALILLNGHDRFATREGQYFNLVQPYQHHTNIPDNKGINVYSFALQPEQHQPSGTLNMSRIDTAVLSLQSVVAGNLNIWATNYNVLRVMSGMGGLAYSN